MLNFSVLMSSFKMADETAVTEITKETASLSLETEKSVGGIGVKSNQEASPEARLAETSTEQSDNAIFNSSIAEPVQSGSSDDREDELKESCRDMFKKIAQYMDGELSASLDDYTLLETLNKLTTTKYSEMSNMAKTLITSMEELDEKYKSLQPYLEQIDRLEESAASLEQSAYRLDSYSKSLEAKFKKLEKR